MPRKGTSPEKNKLYRETFKKKYPDYNRASQKKRRKEHLEEVLESHHKYNHSVPAGENHKQPWTTRELEIAMNPNISTKEAAEMLGRTVCAVMNARYRYRNSELKGEIA